MKIKKTYPGTSGLYYAFVLANILLFFEGLGLLAISTYLFIYTELVNAFNMGFLILSALICLISVFAYRLKKRIDLLGLYIIIIFALFIL